MARRDKLVAMKLAPWKTKNRGKVNYTQCFIGSEASDWIVSNLGATRPQAIRLYERMVDKGLVKHVLEEHHFKDANLYYRFTPRPE